MLAHNLYISMKYNVTTNWLLALDMRVIVAYLFFILIKANTILHWELMESNPLNQNSPKFCNPNCVSGLGQNFYRLNDDNFKIWLQQISALRFNLSIYNIRNDHYLFYSYLYMPVATKPIFLVVVVYTNLDQNQRRENPMSHTTVCL